MRKIEEVLHVSSSGFTKVVIETGDTVAVIDLTCLLLVLYLKKEDGTIHSVYVDNLGN